jgi:16S rRNA processing protein RimM
VTAPAPDDWVWLAHIRRPQGRKGEVFAAILTDFPEKFAQRRQLWLLPESATGADEFRPPLTVQLKTHWLHKGGVVLHFEGVGSISDAEKLANMIVAIPRDQRAPLAEDEVYISDLIGCTLADVANPDSPAVLGMIQDVERSLGPVPMLMVRGASGEILIPFAKDYLRKIDLEARRVEMALPEGLADLNAGERK